MFFCRTNYYLPVEQTITTCRTNYYYPLQNKLNLGGRTNYCNPSDTHLVPGLLFICLIKTLLNVTTKQFLPCEKGITQFCQRSLVLLEGCAELSLQFLQREGLALQKAVSPCHKNSLGQSGIAKRRGKRISSFSQQQALTTPHAIVSFCTMPSYPRHASLLSQFHCSRKSARLSCRLLHLLLINSKLSLQSLLGLFYMKTPCS